MRRDLLADRRVAIAAAGFAVLILAWNAVRLTPWEDEVMGWYLTRLPLRQIVTLLAGVFHTDPPLPSILHHIWGLAFPTIVGVRLLSLGLWVVTLGGAWAVGRELGGKPAGNAALMATALAPFHLVEPISARWYSLYSALAVWNFYFFLRFYDRDKPGGTLRNWAGYVASGLLLWYTSYAGVVAFFGHLLAWLSDRRPVVLWQSLRAWGAIFILYVFEFPVLLDTFGWAYQFGSTQLVPTSLVARNALLAWGSLAGETAVPWQLWVSLPAAAFAASAAYLAFRRRQAVLKPLLAALSPIIVLNAVRMLSLKRCLTFTPFLTIALGVLVAAATADDRRILRTAAVSALLLFIGTMGQMFRTNAWLTPRWTDPYASVLAEMKARGELAPGTLVLTNADSVTYYLSDPTGLAAQQTYRRIPEVFTAIPIANFDLALPGLRQGTLPGGPYDRVALVFGGFTIDDPRSLRIVDDELSALGFSPLAERRYAPDPNAEFKSRILRRPVPGHRIWVKTYRLRKGRQ